MNLDNLITAAIKTYWMVMQITKGISNCADHFESHFLSFFHFVNNN